MKNIVKPAIALFVICLVSSVLLAVTNSITKDKIAETEILNAEKSRKIVFAEAASFGEQKEVEISGKKVAYSEALDENGKTLGYVFTSDNKGYGGTVSVMTSVGNDGKVIKSVVLSMPDETPGLGQNASKEDFIGQFAGKQGPFIFSKTEKSDTVIKGVTSASFTSKAVIGSVNDALEAFNLIGGEENE